jgi:hypothetical protein
MQLLASDDMNMRVGALWAMRNTLRTSDPSTRQTVMTHLCWPRLVTSVSTHVLLIDYLNVCSTGCATILILKFKNKP